MSLPTQKIAPVIPPAEMAAALGGEATRPPGLATVPVTRPVEDPALAAKRQAFTAAALAAENPAAAAPIGHPSFDPAPDAILARRQAVETIRTRLGDLARRIQADAGELAPLLDGLKPDKALVKSAEAFDVDAGVQFLQALQAVVDGLTAPAAVEKK